MYGCRKKWHLLVLTVSFNFWDYYTQETPITVGAELPFSVFTVKLLLPFLLLSLVEFELEVEEWWWWWLLLFVNWLTLSGLLMSCGLAPTGFRWGSGPFKFSPRPRPENPTPPLKNCPNCWAAAKWLLLWWWWWFDLWWLDIDNGLNGDERPRIDEGVGGDLDEVDEEDDEVIRWWLPEELAKTPCELLWLLVAVELIILIEELAAELTEEIRSSRHGVMGDWRLGRLTAGLAELDGDGRIPDGQGEVRAGDINDNPGEVKENPTKNTNHLCKKNLHFLGIWITWVSTNLD